MTLFEFILVFILVIALAIATAMATKLSHPIEIKIVYPMPPQEAVILSDEDKKFLDEQQRVIDAATALQDLFGVSESEVIPK